jgi:hypothetical protein
MTSAIGTTLAIVVIVITAPVVLPLALILRCHRWAINVFRDYYR